MCSDNHLANTASIEDTIKSILRLEGDTLGENYLKYLGAAKDVYMELNLHIIRETKRMWLPVDKRTNSIQIPQDEGYMFFCSICVEDDMGRLVPLVINKNLKSDIVDVSLDKSCYCECDCKSSTCGSITNYETIYEQVPAKMPDGSTVVFDATTKKRVNKDGSLVIRKEYPKAFYDGEDWVDTRLDVTEEFLCKLEVKECGCVKDCHENIVAIEKCCGAGFFAVDCGTTHCGMAPDALTFNFSEGGDRIVLPSSFQHNKALVRFFVDAPLKSIRIPLFAKKCLMYGIKTEVSIFDKKESINRINTFAAMYRAEKEKLRTLLNRYSLRKFYEFILGHKKML